MSLERQFATSQDLGSLQGCLVEGDPEQRRRERNIRRRALAVSVVRKVPFFSCWCLCRCSTSRPDWARR